ncbi:DUF2972 domain-containing protein, partial [Campylobacter sp. RM3125]|uniref:DUF2972 domain-containing protein n=1 Tax=Campylobacter molothri TaxID=1032242 RepID=UPI00301BD523|nr:DUF2972 domain-containing protein [Campylobacter sp. RM3125]MBZ7971982.1 DUF2972 domain-containing protein [Campylobacter sp. RM3124]
AGTLSGYGAIMSFFEKCKLNYLYHHTDPMKIRYLNHYIFLQKKQFNIIVYSQLSLSYNMKDFDKFFKLIDKKIPILFLVRDPISRLKTGINHPIANPNSIKDLNLNTNVYDVFKNKMYVGDFGKNFCYSEEPSMKYLPRWIINDILFQTSLINFLRYRDIFYLDMEEIKPARAFDTMCVLADKFNFEKPTDKLFFKGIMNGDLMLFIPLNFYASKKNIIKNDDVVYKDKSSIYILISSNNLIEFYKQSKEYINFNKEFFDHPLKYENLGIFLKQQEFERLKKDNSLFDATKKYLNNFVKALEERIELEKAKLFKEKDVLNYFKENKELRLKLKNILDKELVHIKKYRPDIVASWKYYQEFEKMCEELDGESEIKQIENNSN